MLLERNCFSHQVIPLFFVSLLEIDVGITTKHGQGAELLCLGLVLLFEAWLFAGGKHLRVSIA